MTGSHDPLSGADALAFCSRMGAIEAQLARPFSKPGEVLQREGLVESSLAKRRAELAALISAPEAAHLRAAFAAAYDHARTARREDAPVSGETPRPLHSVAAPDLGAPRTPTLATPTFMQVAPPVAAAAPPASPPAFALPAAGPAPPPLVSALPDGATAGPDETAFLRFVPAEPTLPFVPGDAKAFVAAALAAREETTTDAVAMGDEATTAASGDETQALDLRKLLGEVHPFEREVERSLPAFVDFLVELTRGSGREDEIGARFGVPTTAEREQVLAAWRKRWDAEPAVRAEWQRLYAERARR